MRILLVGAGGVGDAIAKIAARRSFFETMIVSDYDLGRAERSVAWITERHGDQGGRFVAAQIDASDAAAVERVAREHGATHVMNAVEPKFVPTIFAGALAAGADYLDMAMSLSSPHPTEPHALTGVKLGDEQFAAAAEWEAAGRLALVGMGVEPGLSDVFARYAADHLFSEIDELGTRDGANLVVRDDEGNEIFAPSFSIWTTIEECLNPPVVWEKDRGWFTTAPFSEPEVFDFPEGIGPVECVNVEHEEVLLMPRWVDAKRVTFKYGLGDEFIGILKTLNQLGLDRTAPGAGALGERPRRGQPPRRRGRGPARPGDPRAPDDRQDLRRTLGHRYSASTARPARCTCTTWPTTSGRWPSTRPSASSGRPRSTPSSRSSCSPPARGAVRACSGPEAFDAQAFLELMARPEAEGGYGQAWGHEERTPAAV